MVLDLIEESYGIKVYAQDKIKNVYKLETDKGKLCLKVSKYDIKQYEFIVSVINYLLNKNYEHILPLYKTLDGKDYIKVDEGYAILTNFIEAREADYKNIEETKMCVNALANMHLSSRGFNYKIKVRNLYGRWVERFKKRSNELLYFKALCTGKDQKSEFDNIFLKYFDRHYRQSLKCLRDFEKSNYDFIINQHKLLSEVCHHDTANHNFLISNDKIYLIDFDYAIMDTHLHDISSFLIRNLRYGNWSKSLFDFILNEYSKKIPITDEEIYLIFCFMEFPQDFWQVGLQYYVEKQPWSDENFLRRLNRVVLDCDNRFNFLEELEGYYGKYRQNN